MKKFSLTLFAALLFIAATLQASAQTQQTRQVSGFNSIASAGAFDVHVKIDGTESLKLTAGEAVINEIETVVENNKLHIRFKNNHEWHNENHSKIEVYVTAKSLSALSIAGSGYFKVDGELTGEDVKLDISGSGNITTAVKSEKIHTLISGSGVIDVTGNANDASFTITGSGDLKAKEFKVNMASVSIAGSGKAYVNAEKTIAAHIAGSGSVVYSGNATVNEFRSAGSGSITKAK